MAQNGLGAAALKRGGRAKHHAAGGRSEAEEESAEEAEDLKEGRRSEKYNAVGSETEKEATAGGYGGHKHGGHVKKKAVGGPVALKRGGKVHRGSMPMMVEGKAPRHRMDRPGRKRGGGVGADTSPMTAAARLSAPSGVHNPKPDREDN